MALLEDLESTLAQAAAAFNAAPDAKALEAVRVEYLGNRGKLKSLLGRMGEVSKEQKPVIGKRANEINAAIQALYETADDSWTIIHNAGGWQEFEETISQFPQGEASRIIALEAILAVCRFIIERK